MRLGTHILSLALFGAALVAASASCAGPGAGVAEFTSGDGTAATTGGDDDDNSSGSSSSSSGAAAPAGDKVFGTQAFAYTAPAENADDHTDGTHAGQVPMEGKGCVATGCHLGGTQPWVVAGSVFAANTGGAFTGQAEIGIVTPDNKGSLLYSDKQGNFWTDTGDPPPAGSIVGIRVAGGKTIFMGEALPAPPGSQNCNAAGGCHGDATNRIYASF